MPQKLETIRLSLNFHQGIDAQGYDASTYYPSGREDNPLLFSPRVV